MVALFLSVALGAAAAIVAWRQRPEPGATPLVVLLVGQSWWSACIIFEQQAVDLATRIFWTNVSVLGVVLIPVAWVAFALAYTGRDRYLQPRYVALLSVIPVLSVVIVLLPGFEALYSVRVVGVGGSGLAQLEQAGPWVGVLAGYTYLLGLLGAMPLVGLLASGAVTFRRQGVALLVGILMPWVTNALFLAGAFPGAAIDPTPIAFSVSGLAYLSALTRHRLFGTSPAPNRRARQHLFDEMHMGAIVVDRNDHIVDLNDTFEAIIGHDRATVLGTPAGEWLPDYGSFPDDGTRDGPLALGESGDAYDVTVTPIDDIRGRTIGRVITFHDISELLRQQQRLTVLNRLLRHNIRTETNVIHGYASELEGEAARIIQASALRIADFGEKGRTAVTLFDEAHGGPDPKPLAALLEYAIRVVREDYEVAVSQDVPEATVYVASVLAPVFVNLFENAAEHTMGPVEIRVAARVVDDEVEITVADNGPGISASELGVLEAGTETALKHGSGLGLWIVKWGVDIAGGTIDFTASDDTGTRATITVPSLSKPDRGTSPKSDHTSTEPDRGTSSDHDTAWSRHSSE